MFYRDHRTPLRKITLFFWQPTSEKDKTTRPPTLIVAPPKKFQTCSPSENVDCEVYVP